MDRKSVILTKPYPNGDYRWWNPLSWYKNISFVHDTMNDIHIRVRGKRTYVTADLIGHELIKEMSE